MEAALSSPFSQTFLISLIKSRFDNRNKPSLQNLKWIFRLYVSLTPKAINQDRPIQGL